MASNSQFLGPNEAYILELYDQYLASPDSVDAETRRFFEQWTPPSSRGSTDGTLTQIARQASVETQTIVGAINYAQAIRQYGHLGAKLDPLQRPEPGDPELTPEAHGITYDDLALLPGNLVWGPVGEHASNAFEATQTLREIYMSSIGYDNEHVRVPEERQWLRDAVESRRYRFTGDKESVTSLLERLTQVETFEHFLQRSFPTKYRFSIEGLDMMVPMLDEIVQLATHSGMSTMALSMAHRGRLNILAHIMNKPYEQILADFKDPLFLQEAMHAIGWTVGDVKYHKGVRRQVGSDPDNALLVTMPPNPSHLELVNPVTAGMARAAGTSDNHAGEPKFNPHQTMQVVIHGDASFPGQGIVAETFNLSSVPGYWTGGTLHIIANNQIGFTTLPEAGRSTLYASDLAKGFRVPIVHVNADDPEACIEVARIAFAYQEHFEKDFLIDLIGYRRYGHNELDEPGFTQPKLYETVRSHPTARELWAEKLIEFNIIPPDQPDKYIAHFNKVLQDAFEHELPPEDLAEEPPPPPLPGMAKFTETAVTEPRLRAINEGLRSTLENFNFYSKRLESAILARRQIFDESGSGTVDWATAEELAFATILEDGVSIRLTGQDSERGTFSHRHAVLHDSKTGATRTPLQLLPQAKAPFEIHNSPLSEEAVLGFELGYNVQASNRLVLWEAQYGDFANGAQNIIDEFVVSSREKWGLTPSLLLLLPHGHEGAGPDHSSGRPERFLTLAAKTNMRIANCTTAAQYFHLLRRQAMLVKTDPLPLVILTPKSLLRNPSVASPISTLTQNNWQPVILDKEVDAQQVNRLVFCSGKFYYDLIDSEYRQKYLEVAVVRVEQLYPFAAKELKAAIDHYPNVKQIVWAQEEPKNMGTWDFFNYRLKKLVGTELPVNYVGRRRSSSPAEGSKTAHQVNQAMITEYAFNWKFN